MCDKKGKVGKVVACHANASLSGKNEAVAAVKPS